MSRMCIWKRRQPQMALSARQVENVLRPRSDHVEAYGSVPPELKLKCPECQAQPGYTCTEYGWPGKRSCPSHPARVGLFIAVFEDKVSVDG